jgi:RNA polymerase sigma-70 factor (ECF subfamily)
MGPMVAMQPANEREEVSTVVQEPSRPDEIFRRIAAMARKIAFRSLRMEDARDVAQEVALACWRQVQDGSASVTDGRPLEKFVFALTKNKVIDRIRSAEIEDARLVSLDELPERDQIPAKPVDIAALIDGANLRELIADTLEAMPESRAAVFRLIREQGLSTKEAADLRGVSVNTVKTQLHDAQRALREALAKYLEDLP